MQPKPAAGDGYLVARAREGYLDAYEMLVQRHSAMAYRVVALRLCGNHHDAQRAVVVLHHFEGLSYAEVAEVTRSTVPAVRSHLYRARRTLGMKLQEWR
jgi:Sigma-70, region 4